MKHFIYLLFSLFVLVFTITNSKAQSPKDFALLKTVFKPQQKINYKQYTNNNKNPIETTFSVLFLGYKTFVSSQDMDVCVFQPSCSVYAIECIHHEKNKVIAFLKISDRLMRCHPLVQKGSYLIDAHAGKYLDPIEK